jgi:hypothetical protein
MQGGFQSGMAEVMKDGLSQDFRSDIRRFGQLYGYFTFNGIFKNRTHDAG